MLLLARGAAARRNRTGKCEFCCRREHRRCHVVAKSDGGDLGGVGRGADGEAAGVDDESTLEREAATQPRQMDTAREKAARGVKGAPKSR